MRQKSVLLAFVEAVHLIDKDNRALRHQTAAGSFGFLHGFADVLDAPQHGADGEKLCIKRIGHQAGNGGFAHAGRPPKNATVRSARFKRQAQRHTIAQHMPLAHDLTQRVRAQTFSQRLEQASATILRGRLQFRLQPRVCS